MNGKICISLTIALFGIGEAGVPNDLSIDLLFLSERQWSERLRENLYAIDSHCHLTGARAKEWPVNPDDVAEVEVGEKRILRLAQLVFLEIELDAARRIREV